MAGIKTISNSNRFVEQKVNYFIDQFNHLTKYGNWNFRLEIENHTSLLEKILNHLNSNNLEIEIPYIDNLVSHEIFNENGVFEECTSFISAIENINNYKRAQKNIKKTIIRDPIFRQTLENLSTELNEKYPDLLVGYLNRVVLCPSSIEEHDHKAILRKLAGYFVSGAYLTGKNTGEIIESINRIFNNDLNDFPLPKEVEESKRQTFLQEGNLLNQLSGFKSLLQEDSKEGIVLMKAYTMCDFPEDIEFEYNGVIFLSKNSKKIKKTKKGINNLMAKQFFNGNNQLIVAKKLTWYSSNYIHKKFKNSTNTQLEYVSSILKIKISIDSHSNYIILTNEWKFQSIQVWNIDQNKKFPINGKHDLNNNPFNILSNSHSKAKIEFLNFEPIFISAHTNNSIYKFWSYLECIVPLSKDGNKQVKSFVSQILLLNEEALIKKRIVQSLKNSFDFFRGGYSKLKVEIPEWKEIMKKIEQGEVPKEIREFDYPFISDLVSEYDTKLNLTYYQQAFNFYNSMLTEAYSIRNSDIHSGFFHSKSYIKVSISMPILVWRLRWMIIDEIKANPNNSLREIVENLALTGSKLLVHK